MKIKKVKAYAVVGGGHNVLDTYWPYLYTDENLGLHAVFPSKRIADHYNADGMQKVVKCVVHLEIISKAERGKSRRVL